MDGVAQRRLHWRCRRGLLELDLVFQNFVEKHLEVKDLKAFSELLELEDNDLWDIVSGRSNRYDARLEGIVARIRAT